jgi:hypothetical protein
MATNTDTIPVANGTATRETPRPPKARPPSRTRRAALTWAAIVAASMAVAALAVATFTGSDDNVHTPATRFDPQAEQYERDAHLEGQAKTYGANNTTDDGQSKRLAARAEQYERDAHLKGQAKTYGANNDSTNSQSEPNSTDGDPGDDEFVPGSRHMPVR